MPNPDPSPETRFHKGRAKTGGRQKGTPNKPKSIKVAMREFTNEQGGNLLEWANQVFESPDLIEMGDKVINILPAKVALFRYALEYGIGTPIKQQPDTGKGQLQIVVKYPLGVDPIEERRKAEALQDAKEMQRLSGARPGTPVAKAPRPLTQAILKAARALPSIVPNPADPTADELVPVSDAELGYDPNFDIPSQP